MEASSRTCCGKRKTEHRRTGFPVADIPDALFRVQLHEAGFADLSAIPLSAIGGIFAPDYGVCPFSISAGIGFIALFGVAALNGIVLITEFNQLKTAGVLQVRERVLRKEQGSGCARC